MSKVKGPQEAGTAEILRANQKDDEYLRYMRNLVSDIIQKTLGIPFWLKWKDLSSSITDAAFYSLTTLSGLQTLGEEYANVIQIDRGLKSIPTKWARFMDVALRTFGYYTLLRLQTWLENRISSFSAANSSGSSLSEKVVVTLPVVFKIITILQRIHLIVFYFSGSYYSISKRLTGIKYAVIRRWLSQSMYQKPYQILGYLAASQLCLSFATMLYSAVIKYSSPKPDDGTPVEEKREFIDIVTTQNLCSLCFEKRSYSTVTPCGHLFCWSCITAWMQTKEECPLCRESFPPSKLTYLQNYN